MTSKWLGNIVSVNCGNVLGIYQGKVLNVNSVEQTITLVNVIRNGETCCPTKVTLGVKDIKGIEIKEQCEPASNGPDTIQIKSDCSAFEAVKTSNDRGESPNKAEEARKRTGELRKKAITPKKPDARRRLTVRDEACFNEPVSNFILETEFDFEKNLALFDKQAVFEEIDAQSHKPDIVRLVDCNRRTQQQPQQKYQCDEHILEQAPVVCRQIGVPCVIEKEFVTDAGLIVPSITREMRHRILMAAESVGFKSDRLIEMIGRAAAEMILQLLGGNHRLNPQNVHQRPTVVVLCGLHMQGAQGVNCARHLANHGVNVTLLCMPFAVGGPLDPRFKDELLFFSFSGGKESKTIGDLPPNIDIIVGALDSVEDPNMCESLWQRAVVQWANQCRAPALSLDPPPWGTAMKPKWILSPLLPFPFSCNGGPSIYLCDLGLPKEVMSKVGVKYTSPFGSKFIVPLYEHSSRNLRL